MCLLRDRRDPGAPANHGRNTAAAHSRRTQPPHAAVGAGAPPVTPTTNEGVHAHTRARTRRIPGGGGGTTTRRRGPCWTLCQGRSDESLTTVLTVMPLPKVADNTTSSGAAAAPHTATATHNATAAARSRPIARVCANVIMRLWGVASRKRGVAGLDNGRNAGTTKPSKKALTY